MTTRLVRSIMRTDFPTLVPDTPMRRAAAVLADTGSPAAPVLGEDGGLVGILTQKDCFGPALRASYYQDWSGTVADHMSPQVVTLTPDTDVTTAAEMFLTHPHRLFPVCEGAKPIGLLRRSDVLRVLTRDG